MSGSPSFIISHGMKLLNSVQIYEPDETFLFPPGLPPMRSGRSRYGWTLSSDGKSWADGEELDFQNVLEATGIPEERIEELLEFQRNPTSDAL
jgi:hypothetical protein